MRYVDFDLIYAAKTGNLALAKQCIQNGADARLCDNTEMTALHWAAYDKHNKIVRLLLPISNVYATDYVGETALGFAEGFGYKQTARIIRKFLDSNPKEVLNETFDDVADDQGRKLISACRTGDLDLLKDYLHHGFDPDYVLPESGWGVLAYAASNGNQDFIRFALSVANPHTVSNDGWTPLMIAAMCGEKGCVSELWPFSKVDRVDISGKTALDLARSHKHQAVVEMIEAYLLGQKEQKELGVLVEQPAKKKSSLETGL